MTDSHLPGAIGPRPVITPKRMTCTGCPSLKTRYWTYNSDSGTDAECTAAQKPVTGYWRDDDSAPDWCPAAALKDNPNG